MIELTNFWYKTLAFDIMSVKEIQNSSRNNDNSIIKILFCVDVSLRCLTHFKMMHSSIKGIYRHHSGQ